MPPRRQADKDMSVKGSELEVNLVLNSTEDSSSLLQSREKCVKNHRNLSRKQEMSFSETDKQPEKARNELTDRTEEEEKPIMPRHALEVDVEINIVDNMSHGQKTPQPPVKPSKRKSTTPQRLRRKPLTNVAADPPSPSLHDDTPTNTVPSSPSQASIISETAVEELCNLRNYYSRQLRRINDISHECLKQPSEPGVLACIREPLRTLRLPRRLTITQTARNLWTRVSGRRKL